MFFDPQNISYTDGFFRISKKVKAVAHPILCKDVFAMLWNGFCFRSSEIELAPTDALVFRIGNVSALPTENDDYSVHITPDGVCVAATNERNLLYGFYAFLDRICMEEKENVTARACCFSEKAKIKRRMAHFCVFPETDLWELERFIRVCAVLKYTHLIVEFWGMYAYKCLPALSWKNAYTAEQIKPLVNMAHTLGLEVVPMFNCLGHASAGRVMHGKHVVLDQKPELQYLFDETGWYWRYATEPVEALQKEICDELCTLCGDGEYFHIGCDEIYGFDYSEESIQRVCGHINRVAADLKKKGRKTILWADMFLHRGAEYDPQNLYTAACPSKEKAEYMLSLLSKDVIMADWQYDCPHYPVETSRFLKEHGFTTMLCPWDTSLQKSNACLEAVKKDELYGLIHTTWHTLSSGMMYVGKVARAFYSDEKDKRDADHPLHLTHMAEILRKVWFADGVYHEAGWSKIEVGDRF